MKRSEKALQSAGQRGQSREHKLGKAELNGGLSKVDRVASTNRLRKREEQRPFEIKEKKRGNRDKSRQER